MYAFIGKVVVSYVVIGAGGAVVEAVKNKRNERKLARETEEYLKKV